MSVEIVGSATDSVEAKKSEKKQKKRMFSRRKSLTGLLKNFISLFPAASSANGGKRVLEPYDHSKELVNRTKTVPISTPKIARFMLENFIPMCCT